MKKMISGEIPIIVRAGSKTTYGKTKKGNPLVRVGFLFGNPMFETERVDVIPTKKIGYDYVVMGQINRIEKNRVIWMITEIIITCTQKVKLSDLKKIENFVWKQRLPPMGWNHAPKEIQTGTYRKIQTVDTPGTRIRDDGISMDTGQDLVVTCEFLNTDIPITEEHFKELNPCNLSLPHDRIRMLSNPEVFSLNKGEGPKMILRYEDGPIFEVGQVVSNQEFDKEDSSILNYRKKVLDFQHQIEEWCEKEIGSTGWWFKRSGCTSPLRKITDLWNITQIWRKIHGLALLDGDKAFSLNRHCLIPTWINAASSMRFHKCFDETDTERTVNIYHLKTDKEAGRTMIWISNPIYRSETLKAVLEPFEKEKQVTMRLRNQLQGSIRNIISINNYTLVLEEDQ